jgi:hypothetical protein
VFVPDDRDDGRTMAELTQAEKDAISHRGRAARALVRHLRAPGMGPRADEEMPRADEEMPRADEEMPRAGERGGHAR